MKKTIDELMQAPCWVIDILPEQVPANSSGQYFAVEAYYLEKERLAAIRDKHTNLLLKLNCYLQLSLDGETNPPPKQLAEAVKSRPLCLRAGDALILSEPDDTHMTLFGPDEKLLALVKAIASGEGLFVWQPPEQSPASATDLRLYIPRKEDGWFYVRMMSDPATMAYNAPWFPPDGGIPNAAEEWDGLCAGWIGHTPERFYAYLQRISDGAFVGDVNYHLNSQGTQYDMGVVIYAPERGKGYGRTGLRLLLDRAFRMDGIPCLHNDFETGRDAACRIHRAAGFRDAGSSDGMLHLELTREDYLAACREERK